MSNCPAGVYRFCDQRYLDSKVSAVEESKAALKECSIDFPPADSFWTYFGEC